MQLDRFRRRVDYLNNIRKEMKANTDQFLAVLSETISGKADEKVKRLVRTGLFFCLLLYITYAQIKGVSSLISKFSLHMWLVGGILFILAAFMYEKDNVRSGNSFLKSLLILYIALVMISDFYLARKFRYAGFGMFFFGGLFLRAWMSMRRPNDLMEEFKTAYKLYFLLGTAFCFLARPHVYGVSYKGFFTDSTSFGIMMLIALTLFAEDYLKWPKRIWNGIFAFLAAFFVWKTQKLILVFSAVGIIIACAACWLWKWIKTPGSERIKKILNLIGMLVLSVAVILAAQKLLGKLPYRLGTQKDFASDVVEKVEITLADLIKNGKWKQYFEKFVLILKTYLQNINFWGHNHLTKVQGKAVWPGNSAVMNFFRYGVLTGVAYVGMTVLYFFGGIKESLKKKNFMLFGMTSAVVATAMFEVIERPFTNIGWYLFYFGLCYLLVVSSEKKLGR